MIRLISVLAVVSFLGACSTIQSPAVQLISIENPYPDSLMVECEEYLRYLTSDIQSVIITHSENMERAVICKARHNELIEIIKSRKL
tara:strand:- start:22406 stop:22666 length:261 start_codon:yes stop_codon:yes gene_type:complete